MNTRGQQLLTQYMQPVKLGKRQKLQEAEQMAEEPPIEAVPETVEQPETVTHKPFEKEIQQTKESRVKEPSQVNQKLTIDEWRKNFPDYSDSFLSSYSKKLLKGEVRILQGGPYLFVMPINEDLYTVDLGEMYNLYRAMSENSLNSLAPNLTVTIDQSTFYLIKYDEHKLEFGDERGRLFVIYHGNSVFPEEDLKTTTPVGQSPIFPCMLVKRQFSFSNQLLLRSLHSMFNQSKMKESSGESKFLIKTIKPRLNV